MLDAEPLEFPPAEFVRRSNAEEAAVYIRRLIFGRQLRPGSRVPQDEITKALGMSRLPVREALIALEREGWVTNERNRGTFVNSVDEIAVRDNFDLYAMIYGFAADRALKRGPGDLLAVLDAINAELAVTTDPERVNDLVLQFHGRIVDGAGSPRVKVVLRAMSGMVPGNFFALVPKSDEIEKDGLRAIAAALHENDGARAAFDYARMLRRQAELCVELFQQYGLFAAEPPADQDDAGSPGDPAARDGAVQDGAGLV